MLIEINDGYIEFYWYGGIRRAFIGLVIGKFSCGLPRDEKETPCGLMYKSEANPQRGTMFHSYELGRCSAFIDLPSKKVTA